MTKSTHKYSMDVYPSEMKYNKKTPYDKMAIPKKYHIFFDNFNFKEEFETTCRILKIKNDELAKDIFHDGIIKLILAIKKGKYDDSKSTLKTYLTTIFNHTYIDYHRNNTKQKNWSTSHITNHEGETVNIFDTIQNGHNPEQILLDNEQEKINTKLYDLLYSIPKGKKAATLYQRYREELSMDEVSEKQGLNKNNSQIKVDLHRAKNEIRAYLKKHPEIARQLLSILKN